MRCNRKTACFAVTPRKKVVGDFNITEIWQLRRRQKAKAEIAVQNLKNFVNVCKSLFYK